MYNMREGKQESLELETLEDESSMEDSSSTADHPRPKVLVVIAGVRVRVIAH